jgi:uroporphyrinogen-III synthase
VSGKWPLAGKRILVTRARHQAGQLSGELAKLGAEAIEVPAIEVVRPASFAGLDDALRNSNRYEWLIVTSANAVRAMRERATALGVAAADLSNMKVAAVGASTARALEEWGLGVAVTPKEYIAESLLEALGDKARGKRVLIVRAAVARDLIPEELKLQGAQVEIAEAYRSVLPQSSVERIAELFAGEPPDAATFTSSSTVTKFVQLLQAAGYPQRPDRMLAISIGPITSATLREYGWEPAAEADPHDIAGLLAAAVRALSLS